MNIFVESENVVALNGLGTDPIVEVRGNRIPRVVIRLLVTSFLSLAIFMNGVICVNGFADGFGTILYSICMVLSFLSGLLIFIVLLIKTEQIAALFDYLKTAIDTSN